MPLACENAIISNVVKINVHSTATKRLTDNILQYIHFYVSRDSFISLYSDSNHANSFFYNIARIKYEEVIQTSHTKHAELPKTTFTQSILNLVAQYGAVQ